MVRKSRKGIAKYVRYRFRGCVMTSTPYDYCIIGAGIIGLTIAYELTKKQPKARLIIIDKEPGAAQHQTGRNSGVIHAGVYYTPGSLKATLCRKGVPAIIKFCAKHQVAYEQCGKLIVAVDNDEATRLEGLYKRAIENQIQVKKINSAEMAEIEPNVKGVSAILSPTSPPNTTVSMAPSNSGNE